jgi:hypothetical protein
LLIGYSAWDNPLILSISETYITWNLANGSEWNYGFHFYTGLYVYTSNVSISSPSSDFITISSNYYLQGIQAIFIEYSNTNNFDFLISNFTARNNGISLNTGLIQTSIYQNTLSLVASFGYNFAPSYPNAFNCSNGFENVTEISEEDMASDYFALSCFDQNYTSLQKNINATVTLYNYATYFQTGIWVFKINPDAPSPPPLKSDTEYLDTVPFNFAFVSGFPEYPYLFTLLTEQTPIIFNSKVQYFKNLLYNATYPLGYSLPNDHFWYNLTSWTWLNNNGTYSYLFSIYLNIQNLSLSTDFINCGFSSDNYPNNWGFLIMNDSQTQFLKIIPFFSKPDIWVQGDNLIINASSTFLQLRFVYDNTFSQSTEQINAYNSDGTLYYNATNDVPEGNTTLSCSNFIPFLNPYNGLTFIEWCNDINDIGTLSVPVLYTYIPYTLITIPNYLAYDNSRNLYTFSPDTAYNFTYNYQVNAQLYLGSLYIYDDTVYSRDTNSAISYLNSIVPNLDYKGNNQIINGQVSYWIIPQQQEQGYNTYQQIGLATDFLIHIGTSGDIQNITSFVGYSPFFVEWQNITPLPSATDFVYGYLFVMGLFFLLVPFGFIALFLYKRIGILNAVVIGCVVDSAIIIITIPMFPIWVLCFLAAPIGFVVYKRLVRPI